MRYPDALLQVFARAPHPGKAKTRLIPALGEQGAADLHARLVRETLDRCAGIAPLELHCAPGTADTFLEDCARRYGAMLVAQQGADLGERMQHAINNGLARVGCVVLTGTDCPDMAVEDICEAFRQLAADSDVVLGPAEDGGYYLLGARTSVPAIFSSMPWGTSRVFELTLARLAAAGLKIHCLPTRRDLDCPEDYAFFASTGRFS